MRANSVLLVLGTWLGSTLAALIYGNSSLASDSVSDTSTSYAVNITLPPGATGTLLTPSLAGYSFTWSQAYTPPILGTVYIIISANHTRTVTSTNSAAVQSNTELLVNGTLSLLTRTDVDAAGTVTATAYLDGGGSAVLTYPTPLFTVDPSISWAKPVPTNTNGLPGSTNICCVFTEYLSAVPSHSPFLSIAYSTDTADPSGWLYELGSSMEYYTGSKDLSLLLTPATINSQYATCPFLGCETSAVGAIDFVGLAGGLLETSTVSITSSSSIPTANAAAASPAQAPSTTRTSPTSSSVEVDPTTSLISSHTSFSTDESTASDVLPSSEANSVPAVSTFASGAENPSGGSTAHAQSTVEQMSKETTQSASTSIEGSSITETTATSNNLIPSTLGQHSTITVSSGQAQTLSTSHSAQVTTSSTVSAGTSGPQETPTPSSNSAGLAPIQIGSTTVTVQSAAITTIVSGSSTEVPAVVIGTQTVAVGSTALVGSTPFAVETSGSQTLVIAGQSTVVLTQQPASPETTAAATPTLVVGSDTVTANSASEYVISGQTLAPGSSITLGSGSSTTIIALQTSASQTRLVFESSTSTLSGAPGGPTSSNVPEIVIGSETVAENSASQYIVSGQTLEPGHIITIGSGSSGTVIALTISNSKTFLVIGSSTSAIFPPTAPAPTTIGSAAVTPNSNYDYTIGSQILSPGGVITVSGTPYSLAPNATKLVVGASTEILTSKPGLASYIWSALDGTPTGSSGQSTSEPGTSSSEGSPSTAAPASSVAAVSTSSSSQAGTSGTSGVVDARTASWLWLSVMTLLMFIVF